MIKIIEHGFKYHMEAKCSYCGCRFTYEWEDVLKTSYYTYSFMYPSCYINCPECGSIINLPCFEDPFKKEPVVTWNRNIIISTTTREKDDED